MKKIILFVTLAMLFVTSCKKEEFELPDTVSEAPIFKIKGFIGENQVDMQAGVDGAYLETYISILNDIELFSGKMIKGADQFSVSLSNGEIGLIPTISSIPSSIPFPISSQPWFFASLQNIPNASQIQSLDFVVNGLQIGSSISILTSGFHSICTSVTFQDGTKRSVCNKLLLGYKDYGSFKIKSGQNAGSTNLWIESDFSVASVEWFVDGESISNSQQATLNNGNGVVVVRAKTTFTSGIVREHEVIVDTDQQGRNFQDIENYKLNIDPSYYHDFKVTVSFKKDSKDYLSYASTDIPGNFTLSSISLFKEKKDGNKVYKIEGIINGRLMDLISGDLLPSQLEVTFAVELPY